MVGGVARALADLPMLKSAEVGTRQVKGGQGHGSKRKPPEEEEVKAGAAQRRLLAAVAHLEQLGNCGQLVMV